MEELLHEYLSPVLLGSNTSCHACVRLFEKRYGLKSTVLTGKRALTLRFLPAVKLVEAAPTLGDEILLSILHDHSDASYGRIPLLVLCDEAYASFLARNREVLEGQFILRRAADLLGMGEER